MKVLLIPNKKVGCEVYVSSHPSIDYSIEGLPEELNDKYYNLFRYHDFYCEYFQYSSSQYISNHNEFESDLDFCIGLTGTEEEMLYFNLKYFTDENIIIDVD